MIMFITGASHTGKTLLAQKLLEKYQYPVLSIDLLKMGLIHDGQTALTPEDDGELEKYLWPIVREMVKTAIENRQNLVVEGCYIPFDWKKDFDEAYMEHIRFCCLVMSERYIQNHFDQIKAHASAIEDRLDDSWFTMEMCLEENRRNLEQCRKFDCPYLLIDEEYRIELEKL